PSAPGSTGETPDAPSRSDSLNVWACRKEAALAPGVTPPPAASASRAPPNGPESARFAADVSVSAPILVCRIIRPHRPAGARSLSRLGDPLRGHERVRARRSATPPRRGQVAGLLGFRTPSPWSRFTLGSVMSASAVRFQEVANLVVDVAPLPVDAGEVVW